MFRSVVSIQLSGSAATFLYLSGVEKSSLILEPVLSPSITRNPHRMRDDDSRTLSHPRTTTTVLSNTQYHYPPCGLMLLENTVDPVAYIAGVSFSIRPSAGKDTQDEPKVLLPAKVVRYVVCVWVSLLTTRLRQHPFAAHPAHIVPSYI